MPLIISLISGVAGVAIALVVMISGFQVKFIPLFLMICTSSAVGGGAIATWLYPRLVTQARFLRIASRTYDELLAQEENVYDQASLVAFKGDLFAEIEREVRR